MDVRSFYQGLLHELQKVADIVDGPPTPQPQQQKKHFWQRPAFQVGAGLAGAGLLGYGGYKMMQDQPAPIQHATQAAAALTKGGPTAPAAPDLKNPVVREGFMRALKPDQGAPLEAPPSTAQEIADGTVRADMKAWTGSMAARGANWASGGRLFNAGPVGRFAGRVANYQKAALGKLINPNSLMGMGRYLQKPTVGSGMVGVMNFSDAMRDNDTAAGKTMGTLGALGGVAYAPAGTAAMLTKIPLGLGSGYQEARANNISRVSDVLMNTYKAMRSHDPQVALQGRQAAQYFLNDPYIKEKWLDPVTHTGKLSEMAQRQFGLANGVVSTGMGMAGANDPHDTVLNTDSLQHLIKNMQDNLVANPVQ
jgi:hypothetical protein